MLHLEALYSTFCTKRVVTTLALACTFKTIYCQIAINLWTVWVQSCLTNELWRIHLWLHKCNCVRFIGESCVFCVLVFEWRKLHIKAAVLSGVNYTTIRTRGNVSIGSVLNELENREVTITRRKRNNSFRLFLWFHIIRVLWRYLKMQIWILHTYKVKPHK